MIDRTVMAWLTVVVLGACSTSSSGEPAAPPPSAPARTPAKVVAPVTPYVCPMHPAERSNAPGRCSICGMSLVADDGSGGGTGDHAGHAGHGHAPDPAAHADHTPRHGGQLGMQGDVHVELVSAPDGRHRVFLSDAVRVPIAPSRATNARLRFLPSGGGAAETEVPLAADEASGALVATRALPTSGGDVSVRLELGAERVAIDFTLTPPTDPHAGHSH